jgi:hypothetical protein
MKVEVTGESEVESPFETRARGVRRARGDLELVRPGTIGHVAKRKVSNPYLGAGAAYRLWVEQLARLGGVDGMCPGTGRVGVKIVVNGREGQAGEMPLPLSVTGGRANRALGGALGAG